MEPLTIYTNRNSVKSLIFIVTLLLEIVLWVVYIVSLPQIKTETYGIFVYIASPFLAFLGFAIYFLFRQFAKSRLECFKDKIVLIRGKKQIDIKVEEIKNINFYRTWANILGEISYNQYFGIGMIDIETADHLFGQISIDRDDFGALVGKYPTLFEKY